MLPTMTGRHALDVETTGLSPDEGARVTVISIAGPTLNVVLHAPASPTDALLDALARYPWVAFNSAFEKRFIAFRDCLDVAHVRRAVEGGGHWSLARMAQVDLGVELDKSQQVSAWGAPTLTEEQWGYAYEDAHVTYRLWELWEKKRVEAGVPTEAVALLVEQDEAVWEMERTGMPIARKRVELLRATWQRQIETLERGVRRHLPVEDVANLRSRKQLSDWLARDLPKTTLRTLPRTRATGQLDTSRASLEKLARASATKNQRLLFSGLIALERAHKYASTFGRALARSDGDEAIYRVRGSFRPGAAITGRYSASGPNWQQAPRRRGVRGCVVAPPGRVLIAYDYSAIELRVLAMESGDTDMHYDVLHGDVHRTVAAAAFKIPEEEVDKETRVRAKAISFGIAYGCGAGGLSLTMRCTMEEAQTYIDAWAETYPLAYDFRQKQFRQAQRTGYLTTASGRRIKVGRNAALPVCANYPIQGSAADVMMAAVSECSSAPRPKGAWILAAVHDQIVAEVGEADVEAGQRWVATAMLRGYERVYPGAPTARLLEGGNGRSWDTISSEPWEETTP